MTMTPTQSPDPATLAEAEREVLQVMAEAPTETAADAEVKPICEALRLKGLVKCRVQMIYNRTTKKVSGMGFYRITKEGRAALAQGATHE
jgi:hypothetical protein